MSSDAASPESLGIPSRSLLRFLDRLEAEGQDHHAFVLLRHGAVAAAGAWAPYRLDAAHRMFSVSKSVTSLAIGFMVQEGRLSLDDRAANLLPEALAACRDPLLAALTVRDLLRMATGQANDPTFALNDAPTWVGAFFREPCVEPPGRTFRYNSAATYVLSALVTRLTGQPLTDYLQDRLFGPLGFGPVPSEMSPEGACAGGWGLFLRVGELARLGQLVLQNGVYDGRRLLSAAYLAEATGVRIDTEAGFGRGYGYQFWACPDGGFRMDGAFGQSCLVMPDRDVVFAATNGLDDAARFFRAAWSLREDMADGPLPTDPPAFRVLQDRLAGLAHRLDGGRPDSPLEIAVSGRTYRLGDNDYGLRAVRFRFRPDGCDLQLETDRGTFRASAARDGAYRPTWPGWERVLLPWLAIGARPPAPPVPAEVWTAARWTAPDCFRFSLRFPDSTAREDWIFEFAGDGSRCRATQQPSGIMEFRQRPPLAGSAADGPTTEDDPWKDPIPGN